MKQPVFTGTCTAVVTPFTDRGVNYDVLAALLDRQLAAGSRPWSSAAPPARPPP